ncbi:hypothetical protein [Streptomyces gilvosporeus]|uniref:hypothetical protein n=1 Tax=Streptomyces gilvosporeus TaxID=553510 RepID=UPI00131DEE94|nr:hypothetical protein [Streptomyces gilvosporeus]
MPTALSFRFQEAILTQLYPRNGSVETAALPHSANTTAILCSSVNLWAQVAV